MKTKRWTLILTGLILGLCAMGIATIHRAQHDDKSERATPVRKGMMNERQREHSKIFSGRSLDSKRLTDSEELESRLTIGSEEGGFSFEDRPTLDELIKERICKSDAILIGKVTSKESQLTLEEDFIFTDYTTTVESLLKDDPHQSLQRVKNIVVSRPGGKVSLNGRTITVVDRGAARLLIGDKYLLFLQRIPKTGAYTTLPGSSSISEVNGELKKLTEHKRGEILPDTFLSSVTGLVNLYGRVPCESMR